MAEDRSKDLEEVNAIWFKDNQSCFPAEYMGDDLMCDIIDKFWYPYEFIAELVEETNKTLGQNIRIVVMPSYEDTTSIAIHDGKKVFIEEHVKAWNFFFETDKDFDEWVEARLKILQV